ncbi:acyl-CoA thioesterase [bacterium]|nr:acyl-CoA thioesterase [bacterium]
MDRRITGNHRTAVKVRYSEVDRMGLLYHVNYLEYFELARSDWVREYYRPYLEIEDEGYALVVIEVNINYIKPAFYDDNLEVEVFPCDWGHSRLAFRYAIFRKGEPEPLCTGKTSHCFTDGKGKVKRMPKGLKQRLDNLGKKLNS